ncbi:MAG: hypothetical protein AAF614_16765 [Chloroflexota bacterium]
MERQQIPETNLYVRNFGRGRSRITFIEPEDVSCGYDPLRIEGCSVVLFNSSVGSELGRFYRRVGSRPRRNELIPGGIGSTADHALKKFLGL